MCCIPLQKNEYFLNEVHIACFIDAKKAFDRINNKCLWFKLYNLGIQGKMLSAIQSLYNKEKLSCTIRIGSYLTDSFPIECGVKQGDPLSPALFALYINDLIEKLNDAKKGVRCGSQIVSALFYADDIVIMAENAKDLQIQLNIVNEWCKTWRMELNQDKTKVLHFRPGSAPQTSCTFKCGELNIELATKYKYLGLYFNDNMDDTEIIKDVAKGAIRALGAVITKYKGTGGILYESFTKLYEACVQPVLLYGAGIWGSKEYTKLNSIQNRACRYFLGLPKTASNLASRGDMGWLSVHAKQKLEMVRLWCRLKNMDETRLTRKIFDWSYSVSLSNVKTWEHNVKKYLREANMSHYAGKEPVNTKASLSMFRDYLNKKDKADWARNVWDDTNNETNGNKLRLYRCFKSDIFVETYVTTIMPFAHKRGLAMLRCGSLPLEVELGRRKKLLLENRICKMCTDEKIEDEIHFLLECPLYDDLRSNLLLYLCNDFVENDNLKDQYCCLLSNPNIQAELGKCVFKMIERRKLFV